MKCVWGKCDDPDVCGPRRKCKNIGITHRPPSRFKALCWTLAMPVLILIYIALET